jgi:hypothetical protein
VLKIDESVAQRDTLQDELAAEREELERVQRELKREQMERAEDVARHRSGKRKRSESPILLLSFLHGNKPFRTGHD